MSWKQLAWLAVLGTSIAGLSIQAWYWNLLPDRMATHFGVDGKPNDWMSKRNAMLLFGALQIGLPVSFLLIGESLSRFPNSMINIPNREYWLHPDRRDASLGHMKTMLAWIAALVCMEIVAMTYLTIVANIRSTPLPMTWFFGILGTFLFGTFCIAGYSLWRFRRSS